MDFNLTEEQGALRDLARQILSDRMTLSNLRELDMSESWFDRDTWQELAKANLLGIALPESVGGLGYGFLELCLVLQEQGRTVAPLPLLHTLVSTSLFVAEFGNDEQRAGTAPIVRGEMVTTAALSELAAHPSDPQTTAERSGDMWSLTGQKTGVPFAHVADWVLVPAKADGGIGMFFVAPDAAGVKLEPQDTMNHEPQFLMTLDGVEVADAFRIGELSPTGQNLRWVLERTMVGLCAISAGAAQEGLRLTAEYTTTRKQFDRAIGTFQAVGQRLADAYIDTQAMELTMLQAATHLAEGQESSMAVATAKFWASDGGNRVGHAALHVHGGISIDLDYPIHRYFLWLKQNEFTLGAATPQLVDLGALIAAS
jgi:3-oxocholest-4-en-26-oyl-CoA dehydrogenase beta subunit